VQGPTSAQALTAIESSLASAGRRVLGRCAELPP
jgi:hypothetical protein